ncbi:16196_t:CDS:2, partial [Gigaspora rosea]
PSEAFESSKTKKTSDTKLKNTCIDCHVQVSTNNKQEYNEKQTPENLVDFIFNSLPSNYDSDNYLFEKRFFISLEPLIDIGNLTSEDHINKDITEYLINHISKADNFSWIYHKCNIAKKSTAFVYYCNCHEELKSKKPWAAEISSRQDTLPRIN